jgi:hypothetical protein
LHYVVFKLKLKTGINYSNNQDAMNLKKRTFGRPRRRREDSIKMSIKEIGWKWCGLVLCGS